MPLRYCGIFWPPSGHPSCVDMAGRWVLYLTALVACLGFYVAYTQWFSWVLLLTVVCLPLFSLLISLPAMFTIRGRLRTPGRVTQGTPVDVAAEALCGFPAPRVRWALRAVNRISGVTRNCHSGEPLSTPHCGVVEIRARGFWVYDYLGLFRRRGKAVPAAQIYVEPEPLPVGALPSLGRYLAGSLRPKPGGGYAEQYDLRLYRPGDNLRQIHWKLAAKTGNLIFREPVEPRKGKAVLNLVLNGTEDQLDRKLGRLRWLMEYLLEKEMVFQVRCLTGNGAELFFVKDAAGAAQTLRTLLERTACPADAQLEPVDAQWQYLIGGDPDEG